MNTLVTLEAETISAPGVAMHHHTLFLSLSPSLTQIHTHTNTHEHSQDELMACKNALLTDKKILDQEKVFFSLSLSHTHTLSLSLSLPPSLTLSLSLSLSLTHTHTLSLALSLTHSLTLSLSLSLTHALSLSHTQGEEVAPGAAANVKETADSADHLTYAHAAACRCQCRNHANVGGGCVGGRVRRQR